MNATQEDLDIATTVVQYDMESDRFVTLKKDGDGGVTVHTAPVEAVDKQLMAFDTLEACWESDEISLHQFPQTVVDDPVEHMNRVVISNGMEECLNRDGFNSVAAMYANRATKVVEIEE